MGIKGQNKVMPVILFLRFHNFERYMLRNLPVSLTFFLYL